ncbi:MAG: sulfotransferase family 2 domain-containing protein [Nitrosopumilaceae archaeon]
MKKPSQIQYQLKKDDILYFMHIPKTAGTTLVTIIDDHFDLDSICKAQLWVQILQNRHQDFAKCRLIRGHFGYGLHNILPKKPAYITMLRDPIERTISQYEHSRRSKFARLKDSSIIDTSFSHLINDPTASPIFTNKQTRHLALDLDVLSLTAHMDKDSKDNFFYDSFMAFMSPDISDEKMLNIAKQHLSEFAFFGITERFEDSLSLMCYTFGWKPIPNIIKQNVAPSRSAKEELAKETLDAITECTRLDTELYQYACKIFDDRFSQMVQDLKERYTSDMSKQTVHELLEKNYQDRNDMKKTDSFELGFDKKISGNGWYPREDYNNSGRIFRWTGPDNVSTLDFAISNKKDLKIEFRVIMCLDSKILESLQVRVNNNPIAIQVKSKEDGMTTFEGVIPHTILQNKITELSFVVANTTSCHDVDKNNTDKRKLGLAIDHIKIHPVQ